MKRKSLLFLTVITLAAFTGCGKEGEYTTQRNVNTAPTVDDVVAAQIAEEEAARNQETNDDIAGDEAIIDDEAATISLDEGNSFDVSDSNVSDNSADGEERQTGVADGAPEPDAVSEDTILSTTEGVDIDLTIQDANMVYTQVYNMMYMPEEYVNKIIKIRGNFVVYYDTRNDNKYYYCQIQDATMCCAQGMEFIPEGNHVYPDDFPEYMADITVTGRFGLYLEDGYTFAALMDATYEVN